MIARKAPVKVAILALLVTFCQAAVIPGRWDKLEALSPGRVVAITLKAGGRVEGVFEGVGNGVLSVANPEGVLRIAQSDVRSVTSPEPTGDGLLNGTLLGLAGGLALGGIVVAADSAGVITAAPGGSPTLTAGFEVERDGLNSKVVVIGGAAAVGALLGLLIDVSQQESGMTYEVLYRAQ